MSETPRRRWFRFSLRTFLLVVTLCCAWLGHLASTAMRQERAVQSLGRFGLITFAHERTDRRLAPDRNARPPGPKWIRSLLGDVYFRSVSEVDLAPNMRARNPPLIKALHDDDLRLLADFPGLRFATLGSDQSTDEGLEHLATLNSLESVLLDCPNVTDTGWLKLARLKNAKQLWIKSPLVTAAACEQLAKLLPTVHVQAWQEINKSVRITYNNQHDLPLPPGIVNP